MGIVYLKDKPESESFSYAYVEDADGNLVRVSKDKLKKELGIVDPFNAKITLLRDEWTIDEDSKYYFQPVILDEITLYSRVELLATPKQIVQLMNEEITLFLGNDEGTIYAYCVNGIPSADMSFDVRVTEVG
jgi:hypothetical protein